MNYISLYRKYRPQTFDGVVGQDAIVQTLKNAITLKRLAHAYLFSGPRGTGKTSLARIFAKALNCKDGPTPSPCDQCELCQKIRDGYGVDVIEIDAASNRGIDEIRELREKIRFMPAESRYKVYIIDEVHMLTAEAFNALLKTLEEPPAHVIFILATTEHQKLPLTITSRCQQFKFRRIAFEQIKGILGHIIDEEKIKIDPAATDMIARHSEGALRDAISLLDQLISFCSRDIKGDDVVLLLGTGDENLYFEILTHLLNKDVSGILKVIKKAIDEGNSLPQLTRGLILNLRNLLLIKLGAEDMLEVFSRELTVLKEQSQNFETKELETLLQKLTQAEIDMKWHPQPRLILEVTLIELSQGMPGAGQIKKNEIKEIEPANPDIFSKIKDNWLNILEKVKQKSIFSYVSLYEGRPAKVENNRLIVNFKDGFSFHKERLEEISNKKAVEDTLAEVLNAAIHLECRLGTEGVETSPKHAAGSGKIISVEELSSFFDGQIVR